MTKYREIIRLTGLGFSQRNIMASCGVSQKTVVKVQKRARELNISWPLDESMALLSEEEQESAIKKGIAAIEKVCGVTPKGFRSPEGELTLDTLRIAKKNGLVYSSNLCDDDRPYWKDLGEDKILEIPIHWVNYDLPYFAFNYHPAFPAGQGRIANYTGVLNNWKDEFFGCHEYGLCYVLQLDPAAIGAPGRIGLLEELLDYIETFDGVWWTTGEEMYDYCLKNQQEK